ncbi:MAG: hypothetical protein MUE45_07630 [Methanoregulaceae archaeon]|jgi:hypothetical protein|nr:hypothetical protein [Methanoregulaceae archaeon]MCU0629328.1 hypothetical protein [Methanoregulaceae archaeon]
MKKTIILALSIGLLFMATGFAMADRGIDPVPETQGIVTSTTIDAVGNFESHTELAWTTTTSGGGLSGVPPLGEEAAYYETVYTEDTQSSGTGLILYDKELDIETGAQISGQYNVEATKQLTFVGIDGARVYSDEFIMVSGSANPTATGNAVICPFGADVSSQFPAYCNRVSAGSTIDMTVANVRTTSTDRFVMPSGDHPVELNHDILVTELVDGIPSQGSASAFLRVLIQEGSSGDPANMTERIEFEETTAISGDITLFEKVQHYESGMVR